jgi:hypothetical protein
MKAMITAAAAAVLIALALTGCAGGDTSLAPAVTATHTVTSTHAVIQALGTGAPAPAVTKTVTQTASEPAPTVTQTVSAPAPSQASGGGSTSSGSGKGHAIARFKGSGTQNTASFTTPDNWALSWSYWGCPGGSDNRIVTEYNADGSIGETPRQKEDLRLDSVKGGSDHEANSTASNVLGAIPRPVIALRSTSASPQRLVCRDVLPAQPLRTPAVEVSPAQRPWTACHARRIRLVTSP